MVSAFSFLYINYDVSHGKFIFIMLGYFGNPEFELLFFQPLHLLYCFSLFSPSFWISNIKKGRNFSFHPQYLLTFLSYFPYLCLSVLHSGYFSFIWQFIYSLVLLICYIYNIVSFISRSSTGPFQKYLESYLSCVLLF